MSPPREATPSEGPKGPSARDFDEADTQTRTSGVWSREAEE
jgi:hypothetical protein